MRPVSRGLLACGLLLGLPGPALAAPAPRASMLPAPAVAGLRIGPIETSSIGMALLLSPEASTGCKGRVRGTLTFFAASNGAAVDGEIVQGPAGCELPLTLSYEAFPQEALGSARADGVDVRVRGEQMAGSVRRPIDWAATVPRAAIGLTESMKVTLRRFVRVPDLHLGSVGFRSTTVKADVGVTLPLHFDLRFLEARCEVEVNGRKVASGGREKFILHAGRENRLEIPVTVDNGELLAAAGKTVVSRGKVEGHLVGVARLRVAAGDVEFPFEFPVRLSTR